VRRLWEWSNDPEVREVSFSPEPIPWETHVAWFETRRKNPACRTWIGEEADGEPMGQVRFDLLPDQVVISMSLAAEARGRRLGSLLIWTACRRLFAERPGATVVALIKPENAGSVRAFTKAGFTPAGERMVRGDRALAFTLRQELVAP
jgi:RimJ/RimL family protein N-acetyltransferase